MPTGQEGANIRPVPSTGCAGLFSAVPLGLERWVPRTAAGARNGGPGLRGLSKKASAFEVFEGQPLGYKNGRESPMERLQRQPERLILPKLRRTWVRLEKADIQRLNPRRSACAHDARMQERQSARCVVSDAVAHTSKTLPTGHDLAWTPNDTRVQRRAA